MTLATIDASAVPRPVLDLAHRIAARGGRALVVGGWVRDRLLGRAPQDVDLEVHGLAASALDAVLSELGSVHVVGKAFAIRRVRGLDADVSWVAPDQTADVSRVAPDETDEVSEVPPAAETDEVSEVPPAAETDDAASARLDDERALDRAYAAAARRRDLTINAMAFDPVAGRVLDPFGGQDDLEHGRLRASDARRFGDDPVRALRTAGLAARFEMTPDDELIALCAAQDLGAVPGERAMLEWTRLLTRARRPSIALDWLVRMDQLRAFPEIEALRGVPQDPRWHPEGDVFVHTAMCLDAAASMRDTSEEPLALMFGVLCHDFGKPATTRREGERVRSIGHERGGVAVARRFLGRLEAPNRLIAQVEVLVDRHLAPSQLIQQKAGDKAFRRLVRKLEGAGVSPRLLADVARADHLGRTTDDARAGRFEAGDRFLERIEALDLEAGSRPPIVQGRHLRARGYSPGPEYGHILERCLALQDETGIEDPDALLDRVLGH